MTEMKPAAPVIPDIGGFLNVLKPPGMTSHDVIGFVRRVLHVKRVRPQLHVVGAGAAAPCG